MTAQQWYEKEFCNGSQINFEALNEYIGKHPGCTDVDRVFLIEKLEPFSLISLASGDIWRRYTNDRVLINALATALEKRL